MADEMNGERAEFEAFWAIERKRTWMESGCHAYRGAEPSINWAEGTKDDAWRGWQARASLAANAGGEPVATVKDWAAGARFALEQVAKIDHICWLTDSMREIGITRAGKAVLAERDRLLVTHPSPPEGMVMVPRKANNAITCAIECEVDSQLIASGMTPGLMHRQDGSDIWDAAIAAAPPIPASEAKGESDV